mmetsp:Transcript_43336/g.131852  ORF Transcript_43336/g.131852 Transcript_43336/m.131852 type:complete len:132 (+) Transcript_43336:89-484(+)
MQTDRRAKPYCAQHSAAFMLRTPTRSSIVTQLVRHALRFDTSYRATRSGSRGMRTKPPSLSVIALFSKRLNLRRHVSTNGTGHVVLEPPIGAVVVKSMKAREHLPSIAVLEGIAADVARPLIRRQFRLDVP